MCCRKIVANIFILDLLGYGVAPRPVDPGSDCTIAVVVQACNFSRSIGLIETKSIDRDD